MPTYQRLRTSCTPVRALPCPCGRQPAQAHRGGRVCVPDAIGGGPGWRRPRGGKGLAALGLKEGDVVDEAQMRALFGEGLHPDADRMIREAIAKGASVHDAIWGLSLIHISEPTRPY